ncbi:hypothetical protein Mhar_0546 [Methanothrix harundinacea 6Ac]|uniref:Uncharacterized protein n=2 Tax=Methanothrix harundinacea TaxID=301375 RepID=G7WN70_METH6|nr:hypothetical protein Mhar_0546 [Methanothrix harundinacea 6Ac]
MILLFLAAQTAFATVEETRQGPESEWNLEAAATGPASGPVSGPVSGTVWPSAPRILGELRVSVDLSGPKSGHDQNYATPGKTLEYIVTVENLGCSDADVKLVAVPKNCRPGWFGWTELVMTVAAGSVGTEVLPVTPDMKAPPGDYDFQVTASAPSFKSGSAIAGFKLQNYDYVSETSVSGSGQFTMNKDVRSMNTGVKSNKDIYFSGSVDTLMKNEYLVEKAKGGNPTFQECDAVENYVAQNPGDTLMGTESVRSSMVFGGVGAEGPRELQLPGDGVRGPADRPPPHRPPPEGGVPDGGQLHRVSGHRRQADDPRSEEHQRTGGVPGVLRDPEKADLQGQPGPELRLL